MPHLYWKVFDLIMIGSHWQTMIGSTTFNPFYKGVTSNSITTESFLILRISASVVVRFVCKTNKTDGHWSDVLYLFAADWRTETIACQHAASHVTMTLAMNTSDKRTHISMSTCSAHEFENITPRPVHDRVDCNRQWYHDTRNVVRRWRCTNCRHLWELCCICAGRVVLQWWSPQWSHWGQICRKERRAFIDLGHLGFLLIVMTGQHVSVLVYEGLHQKAIWRCHMRRKQSLWW